VRPTLVLAPGLDDNHPDHSATGKLVTRALSRRGEASKLHYWIVHGGEGWPSPRGYMPGIPLEMPANGTRLRLQPFTLTDSEELRELQAVSAYHTQMKVMAPFLLAFVRTSELFSAAPTALKAP
jgi:LmbE family N-acetylglucosaminyl deacetylase